MSVGSASPKPQKKKKTMQVVWLEPLLLAKVAEYADSKGIACNTAIEEIVKQYFEGAKANADVRVVERVTTVEIYVCPYCKAKFRTPEEWFVHYHRSPEHYLKALLEVAEKVGVKVKVEGGQ
jgi:L-2-hydroxyglutarate oxidase LhgO